MKIKAPLEPMISIECVQPKDFDTGYIYSNIFWKWTAGHENSKLLLNGGEWK